ncbi:MAG: 3'-5' exoribonuclease, partial [Clostridia bacterium]|nr:3'-5' exoribonuclease [Clostridia bacterium]
GDYNGRKSFTFEKINGCEFPDNFVKKEKYKKQPPKDYKLIFPTKAEVVKVSSVFDDDNFLPKELLENEYVVFDLETTGTDVMSNGITEIGAVKIRDGKMVEQFTSLIKPDYAISEEITNLTGINEEMVKNSPKIGAVIPDFIKFIQGATLVAHNADFDVKFIKRFAGAEDYAITNKVMDTLELSRRYLTMLKKADLKTVAEHFNIEFRHHRALSDAYATAEIFIELLKIKSKS